MAVWRFYSSQRECDGSDAPVEESIEVTRLKVPGAPVFSLAKIPEVLPDGSTAKKQRKKPPGIYLGTAAKEVITWMLGSKDVTDKVVLDGHTGWVRSLAVTGKWLFSCGCNWLRVWDTTMPTPKEQDAVRLPTGDILAIAASSGRVYTAGSDGSLRSWSIVRGGGLEEGPAVERAHEGRVAACVAYGKCVVTASYDGSVKVWDTTTLTLLAEAPDAHLGEKVFCAAMGPNGVLYTGGDDKVVRAWDLHLNPIGAPLEGHTAAVRVLAAGKRGLLVSGDADGDVCIWEVNPIDLPPPPTVPPPPAVETPAEAEAAVGDDALLSAGAAAEALTEAALPLDALPGGDDSMEAAATPADLYAPPADADAAGLAPPLAEHELQYVEGLGPEAEAAPLLAEAEAAADVEAAAPEALAEATQAEELPYDAAVAEAAEAVVTEEQVAELGWRTTMDVQAVGNVDEQTFLEAPALQDGEGEVQEAAASQEEEVAAVAEDMPFTSEAEVAFVGASGEDEEGPAPEAGMWLPEAVSEPDAFGSEAEADPTVNGFNGYEEGAANGHVCPGEDLNGHGAAVVNGHAAADVNVVGFYVDANGYDVDANGYGINGHGTGYDNGYANGHANGYFNGHANGYELYSNGHAPDALLADAPVDISAITAGGQDAVMYGNGGDFSHGDGASADGVELPLDGVPIEAAEAGASRGGAAGLRQMDVESVAAAVAAAVIAKEAQARGAGAVAKSRSA